MKERLLELLRRYALENGTFRLSSGVISDHYIDVRKVALHAEGAFLIGGLICDFIEERFPTCALVAGPTLGADPLVTATAMIGYQRGIQIQAAIVRDKPKSHGTASWIEGAATVDKSSPVLVVDDVVTSGNSLWEAARQIDEAGYNPVASLAVVDREVGGADFIREQGLPFHALYLSSEIGSDGRMVKQRTANA